MFDVNNDGILDIVAGPNWYKGPDFLKQINFRNINTEGEFVSNGCDHPYDVDGDGWTDVISNGWFGDQNIYWYRNPGKAGGKWEKSLLIESRNTEFTFFEDVDGDGDPDIIPSHWELSDLTWYENEAGIFTQHLIHENAERHGIGFGDINRDGRNDIITITGWFEAPEDYAEGTWKWHPELKIDAQHASMPILVYDVNADGRNDIIYGEAHAYGFYWMEQKEDHSWEKHIIDESWSQVHCIKIHGINGDGELDLIAGKRPRGHSGSDPGADDPLGIFWYNIDRENQTFRRNVISYNARIGTGMQMHVVLFLLLYIFVYKQKYMWIEFQAKMKLFRVFSVQDVKKQFPSMNLMNLVRWQEKGYILKLRNRWYAFNDAESSENMNWLAANLIYSPSYISLHTALSWYNLIPELIAVTTSVTTRKTNNFITPLGAYSYHSMKPELFGFGFVLEDMDYSSKRTGRQIMVATPQKAILDFFYINNYYKSETDIVDLRLNETELEKIINPEFYQYLGKYQSNALEARVRKLTKLFDL